MNMNIYIYRVAGKYHSNKKFKYLRRTSIKRTETFIDDRGLFQAFVFIRKTLKNITLNYRI